LAASGNEADPPFDLASEISWQATHLEMYCLQTKKLPVFQAVPHFFWCGRWDLNPHACEVMWNPAIIFLIIIIPFVKYLTFYFFSS
jgi:hypothetical protein